MSVFVRVKIPEGESCMELPKKPCIFARYTRRMNGYNCQIHNKVLRGGEAPRKCAECIAYCSTYDKLRENLESTY